MNSKLKSLSLSMKFDDENCIVVQEPKTNISKNCGHILESKK